MTNAILRGKPDAGNPHVRFDEGEVSSEKPRRGSLLYSRLGKFAAALVAALAGFTVSAETYTLAGTDGNVVVYVKPDGDDEKDGSSWANAKETVAALFAAAAKRPPSAWFGSDWNLVRISARGLSAADEAVRVHVGRIGLEVRVR